MKSNIPWIPFSPRTSPGRDNRILFTLFWWPCLVMTGCHLNCLSQVVYCTTRPDAFTVGRCHTDIPFDFVREHFGNVTGMANLKHGRNWLWVRKYQLIHRVKDSNTRALVRERSWDLTSDKSCLDSSVKLKPKDHNESGISETKHLQTTCWCKFQSCKYKKVWSFLSEIFEMLPVRERICLKNKDW